MWKCSSLRRASNVASKSDTQPRIALVAISDIVICWTVDRAITQPASVSTQYVMSLPTRCALVRLSYPFLAHPNTKLNHKNQQQATQKYQRFVP